MQTQETSNSPPVHNAQVIKNETVESIQVAEMLRERETDATPTD
jgi:hypothetical protein